MLLRVLLLFPVGAVALPIKLLRNYDALLPCPSVTVEHLRTKRDLQPQSSKERNREQHLCLAGYLETDRALVRFCLPAAGNFQSW